MKIVIAGGHGQIALLLSRILSGAGHEVVGLVRNPNHARDLADHGAQNLVFDLENDTAAALAEHLDGVDAVVFAAGAGPNSGPARKMTMDRNGAVLLADAAELAGVRRILIISALAADDFEVGSEDVFQIYLRAKSEADALVRDRDLDWTIVRPGGLIDDPPTGAITVADSTGRGSIPRADVAQVVADLIVTGLGVHRQFELICGPTSIADALAELGSETA